MTYNRWNNGCSVQWTLHFAIPNIAVVLVPWLKVCSLNMTFFFILKLQWRIISWQRRHAVQTAVRHRKEQIVGKVVVTARQAVMCLPPLFYQGITTIPEVHRRGFRKRKISTLWASGWVEENASFSGVRGQSEQTASTRQKRRQTSQTEVKSSICERAAHPTLTHYAFAPVCMYVNGGC